MSQLKPHPIPINILKEYNLKDLIPIINNYVNYHYKTMQYIRQVYRPLLMEYLKKCCNIDIEYINIENILDDVAIKFEKYIGLTREDMKKNIFFIQLIF